MAVANVQTIAAPAALQHLRGKQFDYRGLLDAFSHLLLRSHFSPEMSAEDLIFVAYEQGWVKRTPDGRFVVSL